MKRIVSTLILTLALIAIFSSFGYIPTEKPNGNGWGTKHKGDSGLILPGDGESPADTFIEPESIPEQAEKTQLTEENSIPNSTVSEKESVGDKNTPTEETQAESEETTEELKEELNKMDITAFWHGVAAVLIGEASALMVAFAWMKIRGR